jgi:hypothetical protein
MGLRGSEIAWHMKTCGLDAAGKSRFGDGI